MKTFRNRLKDERGIAIPLVAVSLVVVAGFTALGVETGRLAAVANEVQNAADIAATAAATQYVDPSGLDTPRQSAESVLAMNRIESDYVQSSNLTLLEFGFYNGAADSFTPNLAPFNAAHAQVQYTVSNKILAGLGFPVSLVTKEAIAAFHGAHSGVPTLPIAIGECLLNEGCIEEECQPMVTQVPSPDDNSAWTGFFDTASTSDLRAYFPPECGGSVTPPRITVGDHINLNNGQEAPLLDEVQCLLDNGFTEILVPVVSCEDQFNQDREVLGFARFEIVSVERTGNPKGFTIQGLVSANDAPAGGGQFGAGTVVLVN